MVQPHGLPSRWRAVAIQVIAAIAIRKGAEIGHYPTGSRSLLPKRVSIVPAGSV